MSAEIKYTPAEVETAINTTHYGNFHLTEALRFIPSDPDFSTPVEGFRFFALDSEHNGIGALVSSEKLWDCFTDLIETTAKLLTKQNPDFQSDVDAPCLLVEISCKEGDGDQHEHIEIGEIDRYSFLSMIEEEEYKELLLNCGFTGLVIMWPRFKVEIQLDEHKSIIIFADMDLLKLISEVFIHHSIQFLEEDNLSNTSIPPHIHSSNESLDIIREKFISALNNSALS